MTTEEKDLIEGELRYEDAKFKITLYLDGDVLKRAKELAAKEHMKYQPYLNRLLREVLLGEHESIESRLTRLEEIVKRKLG